MTFALRAKFGIGTLPFAGEMGWGPAAHFDRALDLLRFAVSAGAQVIDTAWYYGPDCVLELIARALRPYPEDLILVAKVGNSRDVLSRAYVPDVRPTHLRRACERTLRGLGVECLPLLLLRWRADLDHAESFDAAWNELRALQSAGKARHIGLSNVSVDLVERASASAEVAAISNGYSIVDRSDDHVLRHCDRIGAWFMPFYPLNRGSVERLPSIEVLTGKWSMSPAQICLAWLMGRSDRIVPIPGTCNTEHMMMNLGVMQNPLAAADWSQLDGELTALMER